MINLTLAAGEIAEVTERVLALVGKSSEGDRKALAELAEPIDQTPAIWRHLGDVAAKAQAAQIQLACGEDLLAKTAYQCTL